MCPGRDSNLEPTKVEVNTQTTEQLSYPTPTATSSRADFSSIIKCQLIHF